MNEVDFLKECRQKVAIDLEDLDTEVSQQPAKYLLVAERAVAAEQKYRVYKSKQESEMAKLSVAIRKSLTSSGEKVTEKVVENELQRHPKFMEMQEELFRLMAHKEALKSLREAYYMRKDMLIRACISKQSELNSLESSR